ncbi:MAG: Ca-activated chloride channel family protein [Phenylobacterium sp.]|jgi:Ca-activated chloride channel family protein
MKTATFRIIILLVALLSPLLAWANSPTANSFDDSSHLDDRHLENIGQRAQLYDAQQGRLLLTTEDRDDGGISRYYLAPTLSTDVTMKITGLIARVTVKQTFTNPNQQWLDGVYTFPLPELAAVDHLNLIIGERIIEGQIKEKHQARQIFNKARRAGKKASLVEQHRPNIFANNVANIGPGETVVVEIQYQQTLQYDQGEFSLRFPMVVAPRYIPYKSRSYKSSSYKPGNKEINEFAGTGWAVDSPADQDEVPDASFITLAVKADEGVNDHHVAINIDLQSGFPLALLSSDFHQIKVAEINDSHFDITLDQPTITNRDFVLRFKPESSAAPQGAFFTQQIGEDNYALLMLVPPYEGLDDRELLAKEMIFVIDTSGSMHGESMEQAKQALHFGLSRLKNGDRFNVVQFNSHTHALFPRAKAATPGAIRQARDYVDGLIAEGGTQIDEALMQVLHNSDETSWVRQVIFITDGSVGNEEVLFDIIHDKLGDSRLFTIGIGSAPNSHFMRGAATFGRGSYTYIGAVDQVNSQISALFQKLESPVLSDINISGFDDGSSEVDYWPNPVSDLYLGEPLMVSLKLPVSQQNLTVSGKLASRQWTMDLPIGTGGTEEGLNVLWARNKIRSLSESARTPVQRKEVGAAITELALAHHLVTRYTSLIAVDVTPTKPENEQGISAAVANHLPDGWTRHQPHGQLPRGATSAQLNLLLGGLLMLLALFLRRTLNLKGHND